MAVTSVSTWTILVASRRNHRALESVPSTGTVVVHVAAVVAAAVAERAALVRTLSGLENKE